MYLKGVPSAESSHSVRGLGKGVSGKPYPRLCNARRLRLEPGTFRSQAIRLYRLHQARPSMVAITMQRFCTYQFVFWESNFSLWRAIWLQSYSRLVGHSWNQCWLGSTAPRHFSSLEEELCVSEASRLIYLQEEDEREVHNNSRSPLTESHKLDNKLTTVGLL